jgi:hypothetical protein
MTMKDRATVLTPTEARQASPRRTNFRVLIISMVLCVIAAGVLYYAVYAHPRSEIGVPPAAAPTAPAPNP